jgi:hypothetical protein
VTSGVINNFSVVFSGTLRFFNGASATNLVSGATTSLTVNSSGLALAGAGVTSITCGTSSPKLGGTIDVSSFPNLTSITCASNGITKFQGYGALTNLVDINLYDNNFVQSSFEAFSNKPDLRTVNFGASTSNQNSGMTGAFPDFSQNINLTSLTISNTSLTGSNLNLSSLTKLTALSIDSNCLTGNFPILPVNSRLTSIQLGQNKTGFRFTGSPPSLSEHPNCTSLFYASNSATGPIQPMPSRMSVIHCFSNQHTGDIPNLGGTSMSVFLCHTNQLTGFSGSVPASLGNFQAQNNQLTAAAVNATLAAFVAAGRTTSTRTLNLGGTGNAAPTGQGITDKATLQSRGWTVTTN